MINGHDGTGHTARDLVLSRAGAPVGCRPPLDCVSLVTLECLKVEQVFGSACSPLVRLELSKAYYRSCDTPQVSFNARCPGIGEFDPADTGKNVDASRDLSDLQYHVWSRQIRYCEMISRRPKFDQGPVNPRSICSVGADPNIQVPGCSYDAVCCQRVGADNKEISPDLGQAGQEIFEFVPEQLVAPELPKPSC